MEWSDVLADPSLSDLPYKIETNEYGQIVMSPASNEHGDRQYLIARALEEHAGGGKASIENSIATKRGTKVADVTWRSDDFDRAHGHQTPFSQAPEVCVEVVSPVNSARELAEKRELYFAAGAAEVWECDLAGQVTFYGQAGQLAGSGLFPAFPSQVG